MLQGLFHLSTFADYFYLVLINLDTHLRGSLWRRYVNEGKKNDFITW